MIDIATNLVNKITYADNSTLSYIYNANNYITSVTDGNGKRITYKYDGMGQLIRENNPYSNLTTVYSYDKGGNITSVKQCRRSKNRKKRLKSRNFYSFRYADTA